MGSRNIFSSYGGSASYSYGSSYSTQKTAQHRSPVERGSSVKAASNANLSLNKGDMVRHKAFGRGMVLSIQPMGGDALVEIAFDEVGTKRLMLKSAGAYMSKE